jgi:hypothetical protein
MSVKKKKTGRHSMRGILAGWRWRPELQLLASTLITRFSPYGLDRNGGLTHRLTALKNVTFR